MWVGIGNSFSERYLHYGISTVQFQPLRSSFHLIPLLLPSPCCEKANQDSPPVSPAHAPGPSVTQRRQKWAGAGAGLLLWPRPSSSCRYWRTQPCWPGAGHNKRLCPPVSGKREASGLSHTWALAHKAQYLLAVATGASLLYKFPYLSPARGWNWNSPSLKAALQAATDNQHMVLQV